MSEILFKAKRVDNGEWVEGYVVKRVHNEGEFLGGKIKWEMIKADYIFPEIEDCCYKIIPETLCQFTGLRDKHGKRIWENDIVRELGYKPQVAVVKFGNGYYDSGIYPFVGWYYQYPNDENVDGQALYERVAREDFEVIGNIFDNPELLTAERIGENED